MDLLLNLIEKNQLEITTISLVAVTGQFVAYLRTWDEPPLPRLADFVAMAARGGRRSSRAACCPASRSRARTTIATRWTTRKSWRSGCANTNWRARSRGRCGRAS